jgi:hypothetical protein
VGGARWYIGLAVSSVLLLRVSFLLYNGVVAWKVLHKQDFVSPFIHSRQPHPRYDIYDSLDTNEDAPPDHARIPEHLFFIGKEEMDFYSPAFSVNSDMTDEELDKYFETYVPLSRLPTPPPAKEHAIPAAPTSTTPPAPELTGTFSQFFLVAFLPKVCLCHTSPIRPVSPSCDKLSTGPCMEVPALTHVILTPYQLHCFRCIVPGNIHVTIFNLNYCMAN